MGYRNLQWSQPMDVSNPCQVCPAAQSPLSISLASHCCTNPNCHLDGQMRRQEERSPSPVSPTQDLGRMGSFPAQAPCPSPSPSLSTAALPSCLTSLCWCWEHKGSFYSWIQLPRDSYWATGALLIILIGLWGSPVFPQIMSLYNLNQD